MRGVADDPAVTFSCNAQVALSGETVTTLPHGLEHVAWRITTSHKV